MTNARSCLAVALLSCAGLLTNPANASAGCASESAPVGPYQLGCTETVTCCAIHFVGFRCFREVSASDGRNEMACAYQ